MARSADVLVVAVDVRGLRALAERYEFLSSDRFAKVRAIEPLQKH